MVNMTVNRILIGSEEVCGIIAQFSSYFKGKGYQVITISKKDKFFSHIYDIDPDNFIAGWVKYSRKNSVLKKLLSALFTILPARFQKSLLWRLKRNFLLEFDLYINVWDCFIDEEIAFAAIKEGKTKWMSLMMGDDFRNRWVFQNNFEVPDNLLQGIRKDGAHLMERLKRIRLHEKNADLIFSVPDQSSLALRPYFHLQVAVDLDETTFCLPNNKNVRIVHCPSDMNAKGTTIIEAVINELQADGEPIEFLSLRNVPHSELMTILSGADILVDELIFHGPGYLSMEAMACGCAVLTKYLEDSPPVFRPPVISVNAENLKQKIRDLVSDRKLIKQLALDGRKYVEENNTFTRVGDYVLNVMNKRTDFDYFPDYFRTQFNPSDYSITNEAINITTQMVSDCNWYSQYVQKGTRQGLVF